MFEGGSLRTAIIPIAGYAILFAASYIMLIYLSDGAKQSIPLLSLTAMYGVVATTFGAVLLSGLRRYPGVEINSYVFPAFSAAYALLLLFLVLGRLEYSRTLLLSGFICAIIWSYVWNMLPARKKTLRIGVVPFGDYKSIFALEGVHWVTLDDPSHDVSELNSVAIDLRSNISDEWERRLADYALQGLPVYHSKHLMESLTGRVELETLSENSFGTLSPVSAYMLAKHSMDWLLALAVGVLAAPMLVLIALIIRFDSPGNPIFCQTRVGYRGKRFTVYKFRTMAVARPDSSGDSRTEAMTRDGDARVTRVGAALRQSRLDELPQLLNVLKGEMSWIGPRPEAEVLSRWYEEEIPFYRYRHIVRPGITGWAQVNQGHVAEISEVMSKLHYDFYYIKNFSPWLDLLIVARTIRTILTGFGAR